MNLSTNRDNPNLFCEACGNKIELGTHYLYSELEEGHEIHVGASPLLGGVCHTPQKEREEVQKCQQ